ncbi:ROK family protein [Zhengella sp.]|uniref:ROK family transcriptional regulator n=1 Tax=Zhengella sp. TaxID=2282762 RepID=UPI003529751B
MDSGTTRRQEGEGSPERFNRGSNQSGMRAYNERLVLSLVRRHGALAKSDIARMTGLSAQTVSVIMRELEADGLLLRGEPVRGRVGQPSVPMSLAPDGAWFYGLKLGRRSADLVLTDFLGNVVQQVHHAYRYPTPDGMVGFVREAMARIDATLSDAARQRLAGLGIAMPFKMWDWAESIGAPAETAEAWRRVDMRAEIAACCDLPVFLENDATAACSAELVFGQTGRPRDFVYFYIGFFVGGGVVLNGNLYSGRTGNAGALGSMPVPGPGGGTRQLIDVASVATLERAMEEHGRGSAILWDSPNHWEVEPGILDPWIEEAARGLAHAILAAASVIDFEAALIDGSMPEAVRARIVAATADKLAGLNLAGIEAPRVGEGTVGPNARALGAAALPLLERFLVGQDAFLKDN